MTESKKDLPPKESKEPTGKKLWLSLAEQIIDGQIERINQGKPINQWH